MSGAQAGRLLARMVEDAGLEPILKAWIVLDNHDTWRLPNLLPDAWRRRMAQVLQFTLPGAPCVYYGTEAGMAGGEDPENRAPNAMGPREGRRAGEGMDAAARPDAEKRTRPADRRFPTARFR